MRCLSTTFDPTEGVAQRSPAKEVIQIAVRGRKPKPTALKQQEGNPGKRPLNEREPTPPKGTIRCPNWLEAEAKKEWKRLAPSLEAMGVLTTADITAVIVKQFIAL